MQFINQQLTVWWGTPDAPAPMEGAETSRRGVAVTVGVSPASASNAVTLRYAVDGGPIQTMRAVRLPGTQSTVNYFRATMPDFWSGESVAYLPVATCSGRTAPDPVTQRTLPCTFRLGGPSVSELRAATAPAARASAAERPEVVLEHLASIRVPLRGHETIGETPDGILVNWHWYPAEGQVVGARLNGKVRRFGTDWMTIRRDGIAVMDVRGTLETHDGALLFVHYTGHCDLGSNGYQDFLSGRWPPRAPARTTPRFYTAHPDYLWLNRLVCIGIGQVNTENMEYSYELYALR